MTSTKQIIQQIIHMSEMCVKCDGYKIVFIDQACWIWFEMCVKYDGY